MKEAKNTKFCKPNHSIVGSDQSLKIPTPNFSLTHFKYNYTATRDDYLTPHSFIQKVLKEENLSYFDCDVCSSMYNIPALVYGTKDGFYISDGEKKHKVQKEDGLKGNWYTKNWCNPPFADCEKFVKKAVIEQAKGKTTYMLIPARPETKYWQDWILKNGKINKENVEVTFLKKGLKFINPDTKEEMGVYKNPLAYIVFRGVYKNPLAHIVFRGVDKNG